MRILRIFFTGLLISGALIFAIPFFMPAEITCFAAASVFLFAFAFASLLRGNKITDWLKPFFPVIFLIVMCHPIPYRLLVSVIAGFCAGMMFHDPELMEKPRHKLCLAFSITAAVGNYFFLSSLTGLLPILCSTFALILLSIFSKDNLHRKHKILPAVLSGIMLLCFFRPAPLPQESPDTAMGVAMLTQLQPDRTHLRIFSAGFGCSPAAFIPPVNSIVYSNSALPPLLPSVSRNSFDIICYCIHHLVPAETDQLFRSSTLEFLKEYLSPDGVLTVCFYNSDPELTAAAAAKLRRHFPNILVRNGIFGVLFASKGNKLTLSPGELQKRAGKYFPGRIVRDGFDVWPVLLGKEPATGYRSGIPLSRIAWQNTPPNAIASLLVSVSIFYCRWQWLILSIGLFIVLIIRYFLIGKNVRKEKLLLFENGLWCGGMAFLILPSFTNEMDLSLTLFSMMAGLMLFAAFFTVNRNYSGRQWGCTVTQVLLPFAAAAFFPFRILLIPFLLLLLSAIAFRTDERIRNRLKETAKIECHGYAAAGIAVGFPLAALIVQGTAGCWITAILLAVIHPAWK